MLMKTQKEKYVAGAYSKSRPDALMMAGQYIEELERKQPDKKEFDIPKIAPSICISRKIGSGALEIADMLAEKLKLTVVDREILEQIAQSTKLSKKTIEFFDEHYPGKMAELGALLFGEKAFIMSDYRRSLVSAAFSFAYKGSTVFVGRGTHLILPRDRVLAVRIICSNEHRVERLKNMLDMEEAEAEKQLVQIDKEQREFFKKTFKKKDASPYEFDLVVNCDYINEPQKITEIVAQAYNEKYSFEAAKI